MAARNQDTPADSVKTKQNTDAEATNGKKRKYAEMTAAPAPASPPPPAPAVTAAGRIPFLSGPLHLTANYLRSIAPALAPGYQAPANLEKPTVVLQNGLFQFLRTYTPATAAAALAEAGAAYEPFSKRVKFSENEESIMEKMAHYGVEGSQLDLVWRNLTQILDRMFSSHTICIFFGAVDCPFAVQRGCSGLPNKRHIICDMVPAARELFLRALMANNVSVVEMFRTYNQADSVVKVLSNCIERKGAPLDAFKLVELTDSYAIVETLCHPGMRDYFIYLKNERSV